MKFFNHENISVIFSILLSGILVHLVAVSTSDTILATVPYSDKSQAFDINRDIGLIPVQYQPPGQQPPGQFPQQQFVPYQNPNLGIMIQYPSTWQIGQEAPTYVKFISNYPRMGAFVGVSPTAPEVTLEQVAKYRTAPENLSPGASIIAVKNSVLSNNPAVLLMMSTVDTMYVSIFSLIEQKIYGIDFLLNRADVGPSNLNTVGQMIKSFQVTSSQYQPPDQFQPPPQQPPDQFQPPPQQPPDQFQPGSFTTHENQEAGIKISHPANWQPQDYTNGIDLLAPNIDTDSFQNAVYVYNLGSTSTTSLDQLAKNAITRLKEKFSDLELVSSSSIKFKGKNPGHITEYTYTNPEKGVQVHDYDLAILMQGKLFLFTLVADSAQFSSYLPVSQQMINSLELSPQIEPEVGGITLPESNTYGGAVSGEIADEKEKETGIVK